MPFDIPRVPTTAASDVLRVSLGVDSRPRRPYAEVVDVVVVGAGRWCCCESPSRCWRPRPGRRSRDEPASGQLRAPARANAPGVGQGTRAPAPVGLALLDLWEEAGRRVPDDSEIDGKGRRRGRDRGGRPPPPSGAVPRRSAWWARCSTRTPCAARSSCRPRPPRRPAVPRPTPSSSRGSLIRGTACAPPLRLGPASRSTRRPGDRR